MTSRSSQLLVGHPTESVWQVPGLVKKRTSTWLLPGEKKGRNSKGWLGASPVFGGSC